MDYLEIKLTNDDVETSYSVNLAETTRIEWRSEASKSNDLFYQITIKNRAEGAEDEVYYFINQLFADELIAKNLENIDTIIISKDNNEYLIGKNNIFTIGTNNSDYGIETTIILKGLNETTNLPFISAPTATTTSNTQDE